MIGVNTMTREEFIRAYATDHPSYTYTTSASASSSIWEPYLRSSNTDFIREYTWPDAWNDTFTSYYLQNFSADEPIRYSDRRDYMAYTYDPVTMQYKSITVSPKYLEEEFARSPELEEYINQFKIKDES